MRAIASILDRIETLTGFPYVAEVRSAFEAALLGKKNPKQALDDAVAEANQRIEEARKALGQ